MSLKLSCEAVLVFSVVLFATTFAVSWKDCGSKLGKPTNVFVQGCPSPGTCPLHKGVEVSFGIDFTSNEDATSLKMLVYGHIAGVDVPFPLDNPDVCKDSNVTCPAKKDQSYGYRNKIFVKSSYPSLSVLVKMEIVDQSGGVVLCVVMPVQIEAGSKQLNRVDKTLRFLRMH